MYIEIPDDAQDQLYAWLSGLKLPVAERRVEEAAAVILGVVRSWETPAPSPILTSPPPLTEREYGELREKWEAAYRANRFAYNPYTR